MLQALITRIQQRWGTRALHILGHTTTADTLPVLPTGVAQLDTLLGIGGLPRGRLTEFLGTPTSGMTTLALRILAQAQLRGELVAYLDLPSAFDAEYAAWCGVDLATLTLIRPRAAVDALDIVYALLANGGLGVLLIDQLMILHEAPRGGVLLDTALRVWKRPLAASSCVLLILTRLPYRPAIVRSIGLYGSALGHAAALRLSITRAAWLDESTVQLGCRTRISLLKHQLAPTSGEACVTIAFEDHWSVL
jgi:recombination protein RecA